MNDSEIVKNCESQFQFAEHRSTSGRARGGFVYRRKILLLGFSIVLHLSASRLIILSANETAQVKSI